ncbi:MAG: hypothetical protein HYZ51_01820 [Candidatus Doudnabacteria bacterium]|nr:hypothetical protein [Candidatus Doudnabacteria bacterium]
MQEKKKKRKIILSSLGNRIVQVSTFLNRVLVLLQLREKREYWGIVYDSISKQPLDPVKVNLVYADTGKSEAVCITDLEGRYGFLARPGKFKILVHRTNYSFPSQLAKGDKDGIYTHLYHGEFFEIKGEQDVVAPNIPMDPISRDWNQQAKVRLVHTAFYFRWFLEKLIGVLIWFGFIYLAVQLGLTNAKSQAVLAGLGAYFLVFILELSVPSLKLYGKVISRETRRPIMGLVFKLRNPGLPNVLFGSAVSRYDGKFFLRTNPGEYLLEISAQANEEILGSVPVTVGREGVFNQEVLISGFSNF